MYVQRSIDFISSFFHFNANITFLSIPNTGHFSCDFTNLDHLPELHNVFHAEKKPIILHCHIYHLCTIKTFVEHNSNPSNEIY